MEERAEGGKGRGKQKLAEGLVDASGVGQGQEGVGDGVVAKSGGKPSGGRRSGVEEMVGEEAAGQEVVAGGRTAGAAAAEGVEGGAERRIGGEGKTGRPEGIAESGKVGGQKRIAMALEGGQ